MVQAPANDHQKHTFSFADHFLSSDPQNDHFVVDFFNDLFVELIQQGSLCPSTEKIDKNRQLPYIYCHVANILKIHHTQPQISTIKHFEAIERYLQVSFASVNS